MAEDERISFIVEYMDGTTAYMRVSSSDIRTGDHVLSIIAGEQQREGMLPEGKIRDIKRAMG